MKTLDMMTIAELQQNLETIEIQLKLLFSTYKDFISRFLTWEVDDPKKQDKKMYQQLTHDFKLIMQTMEHYSNDISKLVSAVDKLVAKVEDTKSPSMMKSMEHNLYKLDEVLLRCNTHIYLIDESSGHVSKVLDQPTQQKKLLN